MYSNARVKTTRELRWAEFVFVALFFMMSALPAFAGPQVWPPPGKVVRIVVPFATGGTVDLLARLMADQLGKSTGTSFVVENKLGASGAIAAQDVMRSAKDGTTLLLANSSTHSISPYLTSHRKFDPVKDFTPIAQLADSDLILLGTNTVPIKSVKDLIAQAHQTPGKLNFASSGVGTMPHLAMESFEGQAGIKLNHVPYKGIGNAIPDVVAGNVQFAFDMIGTGVPHVKDGRLRPIAVTGAQRSPLLPDVPTVAESLPGYTATIWCGLYGPAGMDKDLVNRINAEVNKLLQTPDIQKRLLSHGLTAVSGTPAQFAAVVEKDSERWKRIISDLKLQAD